MTENTSFRQRLDAVLRTRDVQKVSAFLLAEDQWSPATPSDPEFAMWMMIAGASSLKELHGEARRWLVEHGHTEEAEALLNRSQSNTSGTGKKSGAGTASRPPGGGNRQKKYRERRS